MCPLVLLDTEEWISLSLVMAGKFSVSSSNVIMPLYTAELFPTVIRNLGVGTSNIPAGAALIMVPYLWDLVSFENFSIKSHVRSTCTKVISYFTDASEQNITANGTRNS